MIKLIAAKSKYEFFGKQPGHLDERHNGAEVFPEMLSFNTEGSERKKNIALSAALENHKPGNITWLIYHGIPAAAELKLIGRKFNLDPLVLEDIQNCSVVRPGYWATDDYFFAVLRFPFAADKSEFKMVPLCFVASDNIFITFLGADEAPLQPLVERVENRIGRICSKGVDYLAFCQLDLAVDYYFLFISQLSNSLEQIEGRIISSPTPDILAELQKLKRIAALMRKTVWPLREMIHSIRNGEKSFVTGENEKYYIDLDSHMLLIFDNAEAVREMTSGLLEIYLSSISNRMNEVMKVLTLIATIFIPLTFIAGIYGMNFENMPELKWRYGYFVSLGTMTVIVLVMIIFFRKKKWL
ncbi:MAG: magnesium/cobalt transporter CorA [Victivallales bacterium]|nr:magnesium/cobalt transporter CorA [Victivallales bacterium]